MSRRNLHGIAALLVVIAGLLFVFTETVVPAVVGLVLVVGAAVAMFLARGRD